MEEQKIKSLEEKKIEEKSDGQSTSSAEGETEFKIVYDKKVCIGAGPCYAYHPDMWDQDEDFKATLKDGQKHKVNQTSEHTWERDLDASEIEKGRDSEDICPVDAIRVVKKNEEGKE